MNTCLEICCGNWQSVCAAVAGGANRIELCAALPVGGVTPTAGLLRQVRAAFPQLCVHVLIRGREGNFVYSEDEVAAMIDDVTRCVELGAQGIVCGALTTEGELDLRTMARLAKAAGTLSLTCHRAFDFSKDFPVSLESLIDIGFSRVLTSGGASSALMGTATLRSLREQAAGRIIVMPGAGINPGNVRELIEKTGCMEVHASCTKRVRQTTEGPSLGRADEGDCWVTDAGLVEQIQSQLLLL